MGVITSDNLVISELQGRFKKNQYFLKKWVHKWVKIKNLVQNQDSVQKSKFCPKIEILFENPNSVWKWQILSIIKTLIKNLNFGQKSKFWSKIEIFFVNF